MKKSPSQIHGYKGKKSSKWDIIPPPSLSHWSVSHNPPLPLVRRCSGGGRPSCITALARLTLYHHLPGNTTHVGHRHCTRDPRPGGQAVWMNINFELDSHWKSRDTYFSSVSGLMPGCFPKKKLDHQWPESCFGSPADTSWHFQVSWYNCSWLGVSGTGPSAFHLSAQMFQSRCHNLTVFVSVEKLEIYWAIFLVFPLVRVEDLQQPQLKMKGY